METGRLALLVFAERARFSLKARCFRTESTFTAPVKYPTHFVGDNEQQIRSCLVTSPSEESVRKVARFASPFSHISPMHLSE
jgi:hypothetical protein